LGPAHASTPPSAAHEDLLAYLVRRLLENGANTSFVNRLADEESPIDDIIADPVEQMAKAIPRRSVRIPLPAFLLPDRTNSAGFVWADPAISGLVIERMQASLQSPEIAGPIIGGQLRGGTSREIRDPSDRRRIVGRACDGGEAEAREALALAHDAYRDWDSIGGEARAKILERAADLFEAERAHLMALAVREGGKTLPNALGEVRETIDYLRYYASRARALFAEPIRLPGPTGEENELSLHGRGVFACIAPWNFPLAIFTGQVAGALAAGIRRACEACRADAVDCGAAVRLLHRAGVPAQCVASVARAGLEDRCRHLW
jgi:RHH-type transcriptional regulator, proline utilization regulon repressor / proline dehydrogenase / delta 1-pyrroline-5-carboxylate dehydrogenase